MKLTRRKFLTSGASTLAVSSGLLLMLPKIADGQSEQVKESTDLSSSNQPSVESTDTLSTLNKIDFMNQIGGRFNISSELYGSSIVTLVNVQDLPQLQVNENQPNTNGFYLIFNVKKRQQLFQDTYTVNHPTLGSFRLLLVPILASQANPIPCYEAVVNRMTIAG